MNDTPLVTLVKTKQQGSSYGLNLRLSKFLDLIVHREVDKIIPIDIIGNNGQGLLVLNHFVQLYSLLNSPAHSESLDLSVKVYQTAVLFLFGAFKYFHGKIFQCGLVLSQHDHRRGALPNLSYYLKLIVLAPETLNGVEPLYALLLILLCLEVEFSGI